MLDNPSSRDSKEKPKASVPEWVVNDDRFFDADLLDDAEKERAYRCYHDLMRELDRRDQAGPHYWAR